MLSPVAMLAGLSSKGKEAHTFSRRASEQTKQPAAEQQESLFANSTAVLSSGQAFCLMRDRYRPAWRGEKGFLLITVDIDWQERHCSCCLACLAVQTCLSSPPAQQRVRLRLAPC